MILPLTKRLRKKVHKQIALAQDLLVIEIYNHFPQAVIRGGTAIWRCYGSNRFSRDIDFYLLSKFKKSKKEKFLNSLGNKGFSVKKFKETENAIYSKFSYSNVILSLEAVFKRIKNFISKEFELSDGNSIIVYTLTPEDLIKEKVLAYQQRKKVRDLYDIYFLLGQVKAKEQIKECLKSLMKEFKTPIDVKNLKTLIISGAVPSTKEMLRRIQGWAK